MISLSKDQVVSLKKESKSALGLIHVGLGWKAASSQEKKGFFSSLFGSSKTETDEIDLDASVILLNEDKEIEDTIFFGNRQSYCRSVFHHGDDLTGGTGDQDNEVIDIDLSKIRDDIEHIAITVNSFTGQTFDAVESSFCRVVSKAEGEIVRYDLADKGEHTGVVVAIISRCGGDWNFKAVGAAGKGRTASSLEDVILKHI